MRRAVRRLALLVAVLVPLSSMTAARATVVVHDPVPVAPGAFMSDNLSYVGTIPLESPGVGGRVVQVGDQIRFYVSGVKSMAIYDITSPANPVELSRLPYAHWENEDISVAEDGSIAIIATSRAQPTAIVDTSDPTNPTVVGSLAPGSSDHTITCATHDCTWAYSSNGNIYDLRNPATPVTLPKTWFTIASEQGAVVNSAHDLHLDAAGLVITDSNPRVVLDPRTDPANPTVVAWGSRQPFDTQLQHNSVRPDADKWVPRDPASPGYDDPELRPGELFMGNSETNANAGCSNNGGFTTWSMRNFDQTHTITQIEKLPIAHGTYSNGDPAVNGLGCSGHWFTVRSLNDRYAVAASWYEHGTRILDVDPATGHITQAGFYQPVATSASAAHWVGDTNYIYVVDYARGIDILRFDPTKSPPTQAQIDASWQRPAPVTPASAAERLTCRLYTG